LEAGVPELANPWKEKAENEEHSLPLTPPQEGRKKEKRERVIERELSKDSCRSCRSCRLHDAGGEDRQTIRR